MAAFSRDTRDYSEDEERTLFLSFREIAQIVHRGDLRDYPLNEDLLCTIHRGLFHRVRGHAGRCRGPGEGQEYLTFGPHRSEHRDRVADRLTEIFLRSDQQLRALDAQRQHPNYEGEAITLAVRLHAEVVRVHPFEDGNGRSSRLLLDWVLLRLGLKPAPIELPKDEYLVCLNRYFVTGDMQPLVDLYIRLLAEALDDAALEPRAGDGGTE